MLGSLDLTLDEEYDKGHRNGYLAALKEVYAAMMSNGVDKEQAIGAIVAVLHVTEVSREVNSALMAGLGKELATEVVQAILNPA
jgi:hypothetical protein